MGGGRSGGGGFSIATLGSTVSIWKHTNGKEKVTLSQQVDKSETQISTTSAPDC